MKPASCRNIADLQQAAQHRLPRPIRFFLEGGAEDEVTLRGNAAAFDDYRLVPEVLRDMASVDISTEFLGRKVAMPLMLSPTGASEAFHPTAECAVSRAAGRAGVIYTSSCMSTRTLEDIAGVGEGPRIFQLYLLSDRGKISELIERARAAKFDALAITVDVVAHGNRERDLRTGFSVPPKLTLSSWLNFALYPRWSLPAMRLKFQMANFPPVPGSVEDPNAMTARMFTKSFTWEDARWVVEQWGGPVLLKGVSAPADCQRAIDIGVAGIMIGNHGGRQLDSNAAPLHQLPRIRDTVGDKLKLVVDGGVRRGTDIVKALALGADMCSIGRPYLYGLAAFGEAGVARAIEIFRSEFERNMIHMGCNKVGDIKAEHVVPAGRP